MDKKEFVVSILQDEKCTIIGFDESKGKKSMSVHYQDKNGYKYKKAIYNRNFVDGIYKHQFDKKNPYCIDNINLRLRENNQYNTKIVPETYVGSRQKSMFICGKCGKQFEDFLWNVFNYEHKVCPDCIHDTQRTKLTDYNVLKKEIEGYGYTWLDKEWTGNHAFVNVMDKEGYKGKTKLEYLRHGVRPNIFSIKNPYFMDNLILYCKENGLDFNTIYAKYEKHEYRRLSWEDVKTPEEFVVKILSRKDRNYNAGLKDRSGIQTKVKYFLEENNIEFIEEYVFSNCVYKTSKVPLKFDFYLPMLNVVIEVQGRQHYEPIEWFGGEPIFKEQIKRDEVKRKYCQNNSIKLIEIPYWEFDRKDSYKKLLNILLL